MSAAVDQNGLFQRLRWRLFVNAWREFMEGSIIRPLTIFLVSVFVCAFVFGVSWAGFRFLIEAMKVPADGQILVTFIALMFFTLGGALVFSTALILHASLFTSPESAFLLSRPVSADHIFAYKFQTAMGFSSWAFVLLGCPVLITYGMVNWAPWWFYALMPVYFLGFVLIPGTLGAMLTLLVVNFVPNQRRTVLVLVVIACVLLIGWWLWGLIVETRDLSAIGDSGGMASAILNRASFSSSLGMPSSWVARGLHAAAQGKPAGEFWYLALLWSNGLFAYLVVTWASAYLYRRGFNRVATGGDLRQRYGNIWLDRLLLWCLPFVKPTTRQLVLKDFRTFRRDVQQWGQVVLFLVLLAVYFTSIRRMFVDFKWAWQNWLSLMNLFVISLLVCTFTGRFIFPLLSLEGRKFWILGLLPVQRDDLLWGKFGFSAVGGLVLAVPMVLLSDVMLGMPWQGMLVHGFTAVVVVVGLSGMSVGLGAVMPDFREADPSKIVTGFGGTVNLVLGLLYLLVAVSLMSLPYHAFMAGAKGPNDASHPMMWPVVLLSQAGGLALGAFATFYPLHLGAETLRKIEF
jgi:ABC-2 type transport system permease protein